MAKAPLTRPLLLDPPWLPVPYNKATVAALQQLAAGKANEGQQKMALDWIIYQAAGTYDLSFRSDPSGGDRDTAFAEGRRFVGLQLVKMLKLPLAKMVDDKP